MGDRAFEPKDDQIGNTVSALFYIMNKEMAKPEDEMNVKLIEKCAESIPQIDNEYAVSEEQTKAFVEKMMAVYNEKHKSVDEQPHDSPKITRKKLSKRLKIILISAAIVIFLSGIAVSSHFDIFSFFVNDSKDYLSWDDGNFKSDGQNDILIKTEFDTYNSFDELIKDKKISIKYPDDLPKNYNNTGITYYNEEGGHITTNYTIGKNKYVTFNIYMEKNEVEITDEQVIINGYLYYLTSYDDNIQAASLIDNNYYLISSNNKKELLHFLKIIK